MFFITFSRRKLSLFSCHWVPHSPCTTISPGGPEPACWTFFFLPNTPFHSLSPTTQEEQSQRLHQVWLRGLHHYAGILIGPRGPQTTFTELICQPHQSPLYSCPGTFPSPVHWTAPAWSCCCSLCSRCPPGQPAPTPPAKSIWWDKDVLEKVQRRVLGRVSNLCERSYEARLLEDGMTSLEDRMVRGIC